MNNDFYRAFENKHRGSRELIKSRLRVYLPFVELLKEMEGGCRALDLGCGRGEWLELLQDAGVTVQGIDLDDGMLAVCRELSLSVTTGDAVSYLKGLPDESHDIISGFHLAEHLAFNELQTLVQESIRVLRPAGLLILETPNPENIFVGTTNFYLDPTHQRPIPPQLLAFLPEYYGFARTKVMRLQESNEVAENQAPTLLNVFSGASPDYAVVAQKEAAPELLGPFEALFDREYGLSIETLAMKYESNMQQNFSNAIQLTNCLVEQSQSLAQQADTRAQQADARVQQADARVQQLQQLLAEQEGELAKTQARLVTAIEVDLHMARTECAAANSRIEALTQESQRWATFANQQSQEIASLQDNLSQQSLHVQALQGELDAVHVKAAELNQSSHHWWLEADRLDKELQGVYASRSWRITLPMRKVFWLFRGLRPVILSWLTRPKGVAVNNNQSRHVTECAPTMTSFINSALPVQSHSVMNSHRMADEPFVGSIDNVFNAEAISRVATIIHHGGRP